MLMSTSEDRNAGYLSQESDNPHGRGQHPPGQIGKINRGVINRAARGQASLEGSFVTAQAEARER